MLASALAVKLADGGPIFFRQERLSRFNTPVRIFKLRSHKPGYSGLSPDEAFRKMDRRDLLEEYRASNDLLDHDPLSLIHI